MCACQHTDTDNLPTLTPLNRLRDFVGTTFTTGVPNSQHTTGLCRDNCPGLHSHSSVPTLTGVSQDLPGSNERAEEVLPGLACSGDWGVRL